MRGLLSPECPHWGHEYIYAVRGKDGLVRYIGRTRQAISLRFEHHRGSKSAIYVWMKNNPHSVIRVMSCAASRVVECEKTLIRFYRKIGHPLVNILPRGKPYRGNGKP